MFKNMLADRKASITEAQKYTPIPNEVDDYDDTPVSPGQLKVGQEYVWIMGAEPLLVTYTGRGKRPLSSNFKFVNRRGDHDLSIRDVKDYIRMKVSENLKNVFAKNMKRLNEVGHNKGHQLFERANEIVMISEGGKPIYFKIIDNSNFFMADNLASVQSGHAKSYHVRAIENKLFGKDIAGWLSGKQSAEAVYGKQYKYKQG